MSNLAETVGQDILRQLPYDPNEQQMDLIAALAKFTVDADSQSLFLLNGYAGTGKTSLTGALVRVITSYGGKAKLLAPTGRAAKVFSLYSGQQAETIHHHIYQSKRYDPAAMSYGLRHNNLKNAFFIVDEASMISNTPSDNSVFGTGYLLDDLITYVYSGENCRLILLGDSAQLPPVGYNDSPALSSKVLSGYGLKIYEMSLTEVARQRLESGILHNATEIRKIIASQIFEPPVIHVSMFPDVEVMTGEFLAETIETCYARDGEDETIVVTRSNKRAVMFNQGIRARVLYMEAEICVGDLLLVAKNNYKWVNENDDQMDFIANGDVGTVKHIWNYESMYGLRFADITLEFPDYNREIELKIILNALYSETPALTYEQNEQLYQVVLEDYSDIPSKAARYKKMKEDPYFNALQVKFAYSITCHKSQGGQWKNVFIDMGFIPEDAYSNVSFYRWLYTSFTRATGKIYLINPPLQTD